MLTTCSRQHKLLTVIYITWCSIVSMSILKVQYTGRRRGRCFWIKEIHNTNLRNSFQFFGFRMQFVIFQKLSVFTQSFNVVASEPMTRHFLLNSKPIGPTNRQKIDLPEMSENCRSARFMIISLLGTVKLSSDNPPLFSDKLPKSMK